MTFPSAASSINVKWRLRDEPLAPVGVAACGETARVLARRLLQRDDETLQKLEGISAGEWLLLRGVAENLPWADGAIYLGRDDATPTLLMPTLWHSAPDAALLQRALKNRFGNSATLAILPPCAHRNAAQNTPSQAYQLNFAAAQNESRRSPESPRVLAGAPEITPDAKTLIFSLENARRLARAPLENWLRAQGEEPLVAPFGEHVEKSENDATDILSTNEVSSIGDSRFNVENPPKAAAEDARALEENR